MKGTVGRLPCLFSSKGKVSKQLRQSHCGTKIRHATRIDAVVALAATRKLHNIEREAMHPYPCKFCHGWHLGHPKIQPLMQYEPKCECKHNASHHDKLGGYGCYECECLESLEFVYRNALRIVNNDFKAQCFRTKKSNNVIKYIFKILPGAVRKVMADKLGAKFRRLKKGKKQTNVL